MAEMSKVSTFLFFVREYKVYSTVLSFGDLNSTKYRVLSALQLEYKVHSTKYFLLFCTVQKYSTKYFVLQYKVQSTMQKNVNIHICQRWLYVLK
jgi:hypothetical protein